MHMTALEMSEWLMYRYVFHGNYKAEYHHDLPRVPVRTSDELLCALEKFTREAAQDGKAALALSGGIDSAILARFMPKGSTAYTFRCVVPGVKVTDESQRARTYAEICGLKHKVIYIRWEDVESVVDVLMRHKKSPLHSIETQIYIAARHVKSDGFSKFIFGETADIIYGGHSKLLSRDWTAGDFIDRHTYVMPYRVLRNPAMPLEEYLQFERDGYIDAFEFLNKDHLLSSPGYYNNACDTAGVKFTAPYLRTYLADKLDIQRVRRGESKYIIREAFMKLYPGLDVPDKIPMPRPVNEWLNDWSGPSRPEFFPHCVDNMTGDQKWMIYCLERYLNLTE